MPLRPLSYREVRRKLRSAGFEEMGGKGSHVKFVREADDGRRVAIVPRHREVTVGTLRSILRQAGLDPDAFVDL